MPTALIIGVTGQDGALLSRLLIDKGYRVLGSSRDAEQANLSRLERVGVLGDLNLVSLQPTDISTVFAVLSSETIDEIYFLAGQSSVGLSFAQPAEACKSIFAGTQNILEAARILGFKGSIYFAGSVEMFGDTGNDRATETSPLSPCSPYAVAKSASYWLVRNYRQAYDMRVATGILSNHESPLRPTRFVTQKIVGAALAIARGDQDHLVLGNIDIVRDWGWAPDFVDGMWRILQADQLDDYILSTGKSSPLHVFVSSVFAEAGLDARDCLKTSADLYRPTDIRINQTDPSKALKELGWSSSMSIEEIARQMVIGAAEHR